MSVFSSAELGPAPPPRSLLRQALARAMMTVALLGLALLVGAILFTNSGPQLWQVQWALGLAISVAVILAAPSTVLEQAARGRGTAVAVLVVIAHVALMLLALGVAGVLQELHHALGALHAVFEHTRLAMVVALSLPGIAVGLASLTRAGVLPWRPSLRLGLGGVLVALLAVWQMDVALWLLVPALVALQYPLYLAFLTVWAGADRSMLEAPDGQDGDAADLSALTLLDRLWVTKGGVWIFSFSLVIGTGLVWTVSGPRDALICGLMGLVSWAMVSSNWPMVLLARKQPERGLAAVRSLRAAGMEGRQKTPVGLQREIECLLALDRTEEAAALLPELVSRLGDGWQHRHLRLRLGAALVNAELTEQAEAMMSAIDRTRLKGRAAVMWSINMAAVLTKLERSDEALALLEDRLLEGTKGQVRALLLNNRAVARLELAQQLDVAVVEAAEAVQVAPSVALLRGTHAASLIASGQDPQQGVAVLEATPPDPTDPPRRIAWFDLFLGWGLLAVGRRDEGLVRLQRVAQGPFSLLATRAQQVLESGPEPASALTPGAADA